MSSNKSLTLRRPLGQPKLQENTALRPIKGNLPVKKVGVTTPAPSILPTQELSTLEAGAELARKQQIEQRLEAEIQNILREITREVRLRIIFGLDYTASTSNDVANFRSGSRELIQRLSEEFGGIDFIATTSSGGGTSVGKINDFEALNARNIQNHGDSPPFIGVEDAISSNPGFLEVAENNRINAVIVFGDNYPTIPNTSTINHLATTQTYVAALIDDARVHTWTDLVLGNFADNGVVIDRSNYEMNPIDLIIEALKSRRDAKFYRKAETIARARLANVIGGQKDITSRPVLSLSDRIKKSGLNAGRILEGVQRKRLL